MANPTKLASLSELIFFQWSIPSAPNPRLAAPIDSDDTTLTFTSAPKDKDGVVITAPFLMGVKNQDSYVETIYCPNGADGAGGLSATGCIRGIEVSGTDFTVGNTNFAASHGQDSAVFCNITAVAKSMMVEAMQGNIATGGAGITIGTEPGAGGETTTIYRTTTAGVKLGIFRWILGTGKTQYSNDGSVWVNIEDVSASNLVEVSATDTTPKYLEDALSAGVGVTLTTVNPGANEQVEIAADLTNGAINSHDTYTPAFLTGDTGAEALWNNWVVITDGSFRITVDGSAVNVDAIDFSAVTSMATVASTIQAALRTATSGSETVVWSTNKFIITSGDTTSSSAITVTTTSTGTVGTDISGAGASDWMDADTGNGVVTDAVVDKTADSGKIVKLSSDGLFNATFVPPVSASAPTGENFAQGEVGYIRPDGSAYKSLRSAGDFTTILSGSYSPFYTGNISEDVNVVFFPRTSTYIGGAVITVTGATAAVGAISEVGSFATSSWSATKIDTTKFVVAYKLNSDSKLYAAVCTVAGTTVTWGTPVKLYDVETVVNYSIDVAKLDTDKFIVSFRNTASNDAMAVACTVSGTTITGGVVKQVEATTMILHTLIVGMDTDIAIMFYDDGTNITSAHLSVSGTTITAGTPTDLYISGGINNEVGSRAIRIDKYTAMLCSVGTAPYNFECSVVTFVEGSSGLGKGDSYAPIPGAQYSAISELSNGRIAVMTKEQSLYVYKYGLNAFTPEYIEHGITGAASVFTGKMSVGKLSETKNKYILMGHDGAGIECSVYQDTGEETIGVAKEAITSPAEGDFVLIGEATTTGLTAGQSYYAGDAGAVATSGTRRLGVAKSATKLILN
jgi:hypothetical protein